MNSYRESAEGPSPGLPAAAKRERPPEQAFSDRGSGPGAPVRAIVKIEGNVQGVGFRPFLYRLATALELRGGVANSPSGIDVEVEGPRCAVESFLDQIDRRHPPLAMITQLEHRFAEPVGHAAFVIAGTHREGHRTVLLAPDVAVCDDCLSELFDEGDRRYRYPLINCTDCGPRYTIIRDVPYDRTTTSLACFAMCAACRAEYDDPASRRFHAQANACPQCGPQVWLVPSGTDPQSSSSPSREQPDPPGETGGDPIEAAAQLLCDGAILAVKGIGGFHLACDATNARAVQLLRRRKRREEKPFALMIPDLKSAQRLCHLDAGAEALLTSCRRPITLLARRDHGPLAPAVAPGNRHLGLMLPYSPLHHLLLFDSSRRARFQALVMTSGNFSEEPIAIDNQEALRRLGPIADAFLLHNRDVLVRVDDSVIRYDPADCLRTRRSQGRTGRHAGPDSHRAGSASRTVEAGTTVAPAHVTSGDAGSGPPVADGITMIRRSRGYVPEPVFLNCHVGEVLAVGGHLKNTVAIARGRTVFLSQHIGDLENLEAVECLRESIDHFRRILGINPTLVAHDLHPDYLSTRFARQLENVRLVPVQHHHAHVVACMAEHGLEGPVIGVALDGTGYGTDGHVWGGEVLVAEQGGFERAAHLREVRLPGNDQAIRQPWRMALSYLDAVYGDEMWSLPIPFVRKLDRPTAELLLRAARRGINSPLTSSCGRLFDAIAALAGLRDTVTYEGQAAAELEMALAPDAPPGSKDRAMPVEEGRTGFANEAAFRCGGSNGGALEIDSAPLVRAAVSDIQDRVPMPIIARRFHQGLAQVTSQVVRCIADETGFSRVALGGGCLQNRFLRQELVGRLESLGLSAFAPRLVPPNDGGLALGQILVASAIARESS